MQDAIFTDDQEDNVSPSKNANSHTEIADWRHDARQLLPPLTSSINALPPTINKEASVNLASDTVMNGRWKQEDLKMKIILMTIIGITIHHVLTSDQNPKLPTDIPIPE